jgi:hypothetical protein
MRKRIVVDFWWDYATKRYTYLVADFSPKYTGTMGMFNSVNSWWGCFLNNCAWVQMYTHNKMIKLDKPTRRIHVTPRK